MHAAWQFIYNYNLPEIVTKFGNITGLSAQTSAALEAQTQEVFTRSKLIVGHFKYGLHQIGHSPAGFAYITVLRDPIARVLSQWNWCVMRA